MELRCCHCSMLVGTSAVALRIVGLFKASLLGRVTRGHANEVRKRCGSCGWVNIFHPDAASSCRSIELKANVG